MPTHITDTQLEMLSKRWAEDPSPHLALRLADVHRQRGQTEEAVAVLEKGLEARPDHVSIQVALGRCRLEAEDFFGAAKVLRAVVDKDPGHLVANKLLVRAHLGLGDRKSAADRLELYSLLNDTDPDIETLRTAVEGSAAGEGSPLPDDFGSARGPGPDLASLTPPGRRSIVGATHREPFALLEADPLRPATLPDFFPRDEAVEPATPPALTAELAATFEFESAAEAAPPEVDDAAESEEEPRAAASSEETEEVADDAAFPAHDVASARRSQPDEIDPGAGATATLGALYLAQGHLGEARSTFERVLARDPEDVEARAGLEEIARRKAPEETVETAPNPRIERLERYLGRIRAAAARLSA